MGPRPALRRRFESTPFAWLGPPFQLCRCCAPNQPRAATRRLRVPTLLHSCLGAPDHIGLDTFRLSPYKILVIRAIIRDVAGEHSGLWGMVSHE